MDDEVTRQHEQIVNDCKMVSRRLKANRAKLDSGLSPKAFNELTTDIVKDNELLDGFLAELRDEMQWNGTKTESST